MKLPNHCPSCEKALTVTALKCPSCETEITGNYDIPAILRLTPEEQNQVLDFFLSSGSMKEMAKTAGVSYPTIRIKMDALIDKIKLLKKA